MKKSEQLTPGELIEKYPSIKNIWQAYDLGQLLKMGLLKGSRNKTMTLIDESSLMLLIKYRNDLTKTQIIEL